MKKKEFLIIGAGLVALAIIIIIGILVPKKVPGEVKVITDKKEYKMGDALKIKIENNLREKICFSSCFPYYWEKKQGEEWKGYPYVDCPTPNLVEKCSDPKQIKTFELTVPFIETGTHRLAIPICIECNLQEAFKGSQWFYSNDFIVK